MDRSSALAQPPTTRARPTAQTAGLGLATALACLALAGVAQAQTQAPPTSSRYLSWANRTTSTTPPRVAANAARADILPRRVAPSQGLARPQMQPFSPPLPIREGGLTPASAWIGPRVAPSFAPGNPDPLGYATTELAAATPPPPVMTAPPPTAPAAPTRTETPGAAPPPPVAQPIHSPPAAAPVAALVTAPVPASATFNSADPMAPRPDAPIFRLRSQGAAAAPVQAGTGTGPDQAAPAQQPPMQQTPVQASATGQAPSRYYSVHRAAGRQPDRTVMPDPVFFDSVALDLAQPPETEPVRRDAQGRRIPVANADPSLP
jgi:hypothetical protein